MIEQVTLYMKEGASDKFYTIGIEQAGGKYSVPFTYGRRGTSGQSGYKVQGVDQASARKAYDKAVAEKLGKGYKAGESLSGHVGVVSEKVDSGIRCQLLNPIDEAEVERYLSDPDFGAQEKYDGKHLTLRKSGGQVVGINKKGIECGYPVEYRDALMSLKPSELILDGEDIGNGKAYHIFDFLSVGEDLRGLTYLERWKALEGLGKQGALRVAPLAVTELEKRKLYARLRAENREGIVFKRLSGIHKAGRPNTGGDQVKFKFCASASCKVIRVNAKSSIGLGLLDGGEWVDVGNCTIPQGKEIPKQGVVEIKYLYAYKGGSLYQPVYLGPRDDVSEDECVMSQLKYKTEEG